MAIKKLRLKLKKESDDFSFVGYPNTRWKDKYNVIGDRKTYSRGYGFCDGCMEDLWVQHRDVKDMWIEMSEEPMKESYKVRYFKDNWWYVYDHEDLEFNIVGIYKDFQQIIIEHFTNLLKKKEENRILYIRLVVK